MMCVYKYIERLDGKEVHREEFKESAPAYQKIRSTLAGILAREGRNIDGILEDVVRFWNDNNSMSTDILSSRMFELRRTAGGDIISAKRELEDGSVWSANVTKTTKKN